MAIINTTEATPMTMPSMVIAVRMRFAPMACQASPNMGFSMAGSGEFGEFWEWVGVQRPKGRRGFLRRRKNSCHSGASRNPVSARQLVFCAWFIPFHGLQSPSWVPVFAGTTGILRKRKKSPSFRRKPESSIGVSDCLLRMVHAISRFTTAIPGPGFRRDDGDLAGEENLPSFRRKPESSVGASDDIFI
jgi:hypothetical protein